MKTKNRLKNILWFAVPILVLSGVGIYREIDYRPPEALDSPPAEALYRQSSLPIEVRVTDLISRMTIEEKVGQMAVVDKNSLKKPEDVAIYALGGVLSGAGAKPIVNTPEGWLDMVDTIKQDALQTRLGIPILFGVDAIHGHANVPGATVFPHAIGLGASANTELVGAVAEATTKELIATGVNWNFAPVLDAPEDFRWGRTYESFSSDPNLNGQLGSAYISGVQGLEGSSGVIASAKHFMGIGSMKWGESNN